MTKVKDNFMTQGLSGKYDNKVVFRQWKGRTIVARPPRRMAMPDTAKIKLRKEKFLNAVDYARQALSDPTQLAWYSSLATNGTSAYNMAMADFLSVPRIVRFEAEAYNGTAGSTLRVIAEDKCRVTSLRIRIERADGTLLEEGDAMQAAGSRAWDYTATTPNPDLAGTHITAIARDIPGHSVTGTLTL